MAKYIFFWLKFWRKFMYTCLNLHCKSLYLLFIMITTPLVTRFGGGTSKCYSTILFCFPPPHFSKILENWGGGGNWGKKKVTSAVDVFLRFLTPGHLALFLRGGEGGTQNCNKCWGRISHRFAPPPSEEHFAIFLRGEGVRKEKCNKCWGRISHKFDHPPKRIAELTKQNPNRIDQAPSPIESRNSS